MPHTPPLTVDPLRDSTVPLADLGPLFAAQAREEREVYGVSAPPSHVVAWYNSASHPAAVSGNVFSVVRTANW